MQSTHVEVVFNLPRDEGSTPSASTYQAGPVFKPPGFFSAPEVTMYSSMSRGEVQCVKYNDVATCSAVETIRVMALTDAES